MPTTKEVFQKYPNPVFIETGTYWGDGAQQALDAGFETVYSIELGDELYERCVERFKDRPNVHLLKGESYIVLDELLPTINEPVTFWLDAHHSGGDTVKGKYNTPLMYELDAIAKHHIKTHTILIDDLRDWHIGTFGFDTNTLIERIKLINSDYGFVFEDGHVPDDVLVAKI